MMRKEDFLMETGEYFLSKKEKKAKDEDDKNEEKKEKKRIKEEKRAKSYQPPKEVNYSNKRVSEPSIDELKAKFLKKRKIKEE